MNYRVLIFILAVAGVGLMRTDNPVSRNPAMVPGVFPDVEKLDEDHSIKANITQQQIEDFIEYTSYDGHLCNDHYHADYTQTDKLHPGHMITKEDLAHEIFRLAECFDIDPGMLTVLVYKESQFCNFGGNIYQNKKPIKTATPRKSTTGAIGLTMFTTIAITDIHHQLFVDDKKLFHRKARPKLHKRMARCGLANDFTFTTNNQYYKDKPWKNDELYNKLNISYSQLKLPWRWKQQLAYGAIKFKILLSKTKQPDNFNMEQNSVKHYYNAVRDYNSAGGKQESEYWQYIFAGYEEMFNKDFAFQAQDEKITYDRAKWKKRNDNIKVTIEKKFDKVDFNNSIYLKQMN